MMFAASAWASGTACRCGFGLRQGDDPSGPCVSRSRTGDTRSYDDCCPAFFLSKISR